ncbi:MAG TPA: nucleotidyltransferase family protein [Ramlibacter sp.]|nr:nucleotidyltransferase family protein [Ramlibacter sp.]
MTQDPSWIERALRGDATLGELECLDPDIALDQVRRNGVGGLLLRAFRKNAQSPSWATRLRDEQRAAAIWELRHQQVISHAIEVLDTAGCEPILLKGTALAYWLYADPSLRPRGDTDILIREDSRIAAESALARSGFSRRFGIDGKVVTHQATYSLRAPDGTIHALDLHWRANNSPILAPLFPHSELSHYSEALGTLGPAARRTDATRSLLLACAHRAVHEANPYYVDNEKVGGLSRLVWLYDIHLLCEALSPQAWADLPTTCRAKGLTRIVSAALADAKQRLGARVPADVEGALASTRNEEVVHSYLCSDKPTQRRMDWRARPWVDRFRFLHEVALPSATYMRTRYADDTTWLPWLYLRRLASGWRAS